MKRLCPGCGVSQPLSNFGRNRANKTGVATYCRPCARRKNQESVERHGGSRYFHLTTRYGITPAEFDALVEKQRNRCAICDRKGPTHIDHDHATDQVRGLLCVPCNNGLGLFRDNAGLLAKASRYVAGQ